ANRAGPASPALRAVRSIAAAKVVPLHDALEPATLGDADGIHIVALRKNRRAHHVARLHRQRKVTELADAFHRRAVVLLDMAEQWLGHALLLLIIETKLDRVITVGLLGFALQHPVGTDKDDGDVIQHALVIIDAGLTQFFS